MSRGKKTACIAACSMAGLFLLLAAAAAIVVQTSWFREQVRQRIVGEIENATGGRVEIGAFSFDWHKLEAKVTGFILHGTEPSGEAPLVAARSIVVRLKIVSAFERKVDVSLVQVDRPRIHVMVFPNGQTNLPEPKVKRKRVKNPLETVLDLAISRFAIDNGALDFASHTTPFSLQGGNLRALFFYEAAGPRYTGSISVQPLRLASDVTAPVALNVNIPIKIEKDGISFSNAAIGTAGSRLDVSGDVRNMEAPRGSFRIQGQLALAELLRAFKVAKPPGPSGPRIVNVGVSGGFEGGAVRIARAEVSAGRSRVTFSGTLEDLKEFRGLFRYNAQVELGDVGRTIRLPFLQAGTANLEGEARFNGLVHYSLSGSLRGSGAVFHADEITLAGIAVASKMHMDPALIHLTNLRAFGLGGEFDGSATLEHFTELRFDGAVSGMSAAVIASTFAHPAGTPRFDAFLSGPVRGGGRLTKSGVKGFEATGDIAVTPAKDKLPLTGRIGATYNQESDTVDFGRSALALPHSQISFNGILGSQVAVRLVSSDLNELLPVVGLFSSEAPKALPIGLSHGKAIFDGTVTGKLEAPRIAGHVAVTNIMVEKRKIGRASADVTANQSGVSVANATVEAGKLQVRFTGSLGLADWSSSPSSPIAFQGSLEGAELADLMALGGQEPRPVTGKVAATVQGAGTLGQPGAKGEVVITGGSAYGEPFDRLQFKFDYAGQTLDVSSAEIGAGAARVHLSGSYQHLPGDFEQGRLQFHAAANQIRLESVRAAALWQPGLTGVIQAVTDGSADIRQVSGRLRILPVSFNANIAAQDLRLNGGRLGNASLSAATKGQVLSFQMKSDFAGANIAGSGEMQLEGDYPATAQVTFAPLTYSTIRQWLPSLHNFPEAFDLAAEGKLTAAGPAMRPDAITGALRLSKLQLRTLPEAQGGIALKELSLSNAEPVVLKIENSAIHIESAHFVGTSTDVKADGTISLKETNPLNIRANGAIGAQILEVFDPDITSSGEAVLNATIRGPLTNPEVNGRLELKNAAFNLADVPNGLRNANGTIVFSGSGAVIQQITAETGGGKVTITGFTGFAGGALSFHLDATAHEIRVRYPEGVSTVANAAFTLSGTRFRSLLAGRVTIERISFIPHTDFGAILASTVAPAPSRGVTTGFLAGMRLDVQIQTSANLSFQSAVAQGIAANATLHVTGFGSNPAMLGHIVVSQGQITFFGNNYAINQGSVSFFNPVKIEPILNIDLETQTQGVDVTLSISGPMSQLNISSRSDPPLPFDQIVALLATGTAPTSDPALLAQQPNIAQNSQQMGESAVLSSAIANPVASRIQQFFGVTRLQIDPTLSGIENNPLARVTLQQQITRNVTFTYITDVRYSNPEVVRVEWAIDPTWSAVATRDINGYFGLNFLYKKRFK